MRKVFVFLLTVLAAFTVTVTSAAAADSNCLDGNGANITNCFTLGIGEAPVSSLYETPASIIQVITTNLFLFSGLILLIILMYSGYKFIQSGAKGKDEAKSILQVAIVGLIIMFIAYWIVRVVELVVGTDIIF